MGSFKNSLDNEYYSFSNTLDGFLSQVNMVYYNNIKSFKSSICYCIVEGIRDVPFYTKYFQRMPIEVIPVEKTDGKLNCCLVKEYLDKFNKDIKGNKHQFLFFIDRDFGSYRSELNSNIPSNYGSITFDDNTNPENLYITDDYSIENSIFTKETIKILYRDFKKVLKEDPRQEDVLNQIANLYDKQLKKYVQKLSYLIAILIHCKKNRIKYIVDDVSFGKFFTFNEYGELVFKYSKGDNTIKEDSVHFNDSEFQTELRAYLVSKSKIDESRIDNNDVINIHNDLNSSTYNEEGVEDKKIYHCFRGHFLEAFWTQFGQMLRKIKMNGSEVISIKKTEYDRIDTYTYCARIDSLTDFEIRTIYEFKRSIKS